MSGGDAQHCLLRLLVQVSFVKSQFANCFLRKLLPSWNFSSAISRILISCHQQDGNSLKHGIDMASTMVRAQICRFQLRFRPMGWVLTTLWQQVSRGEKLDRFYIANSKKTTVQKVRRLCPKSAQVGISHSALGCVAGSARHRLLTCDPESWQTWFYSYSPDGFFLWTLFKFGAPAVRFSRVLDFPRKGEN